MPAPFFGVALRDFSDSAYASVVLLTHFDGNNGDGGTQPNLAHSNYGVDINTATGNIPLLSSATLTTTNPLFGFTCLATSGVGGQRCQSIQSRYAIGSSTDFTTEFAFRTATANQTNRTLHDYGNAAQNATTAFEIYISASSFRFFYNGSDKITGGTVAGGNTWQRIAYSRNSGTGRLFIDGTSVGSWSDSNSYYNTGGTSPQVNLGAEAIATSPVAGAFDEWRITIGVGRYTSNYTVRDHKFQNY